MRRARAITIEPLLLLVLGALLLVLSRSTIHLGLLNAVYPSQLWNKLSSGLTQVCIFYGLSLLVLAVTSSFFVRRGTSLTSHAGAYLGSVLRALCCLATSRLRSGFDPGRGAVWLVAALLVGIGTRAYLLAFPMNWDESATFFRFGLGPLPNVFMYQAPNNHVLHSILIRISTLIFGGHPVSIRLPAFLAGVASIPLIFQLCRALKPGMTGYFAVSAAAIWPYLVAYSANGRGYSMVVFLTMALALIGFRYVSQPTRAGVGLVAVTAALGLLTMPSMLFTVAGTYAWITCLMLINGRTPKSVLLEFAIPCGLLTVALTAILYTPVVLVSGGFEHVVSNRFVRPQAWGEFFTQLWPHLSSTATALAWGLSPATLVALTLLVILGLYTCFRSHNWPMLTLLPLTLVASAVILVAQHRIPFERTWIFLIPLVILVADAGFALLLETMPARIHSLAIPVLFLLTAFLGVRLFPLYPVAGNWNDFPEATVAARFLQPKLTVGDAVRTSLLAEQPTFFYLWYYNSVLDPRTGEAINPQERFYNGEEGRYSYMAYENIANPRIPVKTSVPRRVFYVVKKSECRFDNLSNIEIFVEQGQVLHLSTDEAVKILDYADMAIYQSTGPQDPSPLTAKQ